MAITPRRYAALLRGINVGRAKRVAMADLRALVEDLGFRDVRTLLNSGNVVFTAPRTTPAAAGARIEAALAARVGFTSRVVVLTADELVEMVDGNPLTGVAHDPSRLLVAVLADPAGRRALTPLTGRDWSPEALAVGKRAAYLWGPRGLLACGLPEAVGRALGDGVTTRTWATLTKLRALVVSPP